MSAVSLLPGEHAAPTRATEMTMNVVTLRRGEGNGASHQIMLVALFLLSPVRVVFFWADPVAFVVVVGGPPFGFFALSAFLITADNVAADGVDEGGPDEPHGDVEDEADDAADGDCEEGDLPPFGARLPDGFGCEAD